MSESKAKEARAIPPHVHCNECGRAVAPEDARVGVTPVAMPGQDGHLTFIGKTVALCGDCWERIHTAEQKSKVQVSKLVLPKGVRPS